MFLVLLLQFLRKTFSVAFSAISRYNIFILNIIFQICQFQGRFSHHLLTSRIIRVILKGEESMRFRELERMVLADGWVLSDVRGSHHQYKHPTKSGKVTIPNHRGDIPQRVVYSILKQAGLK